LFTFTWVGQASRFLFIYGLNLRRLTVGEEEEDAVGTAQITL